MFNWFRSQPVVVGSMWRLRLGNPFEKKNYVKVLDVADGWVRFSYLTEPTYSRALKVNKFKADFKPSAIGESVDNK